LSVSERERDMMYSHTETKGGTHSGQKMQPISKHGHAKHSTATT
jgi:hypothetical protein